MNKEIFDSMPTSPIFSRRELGAEVTDGIRSGEVALGELEQLKLHRINQALNHPELNHLIDEGFITFGIIKAQANQSRGLSLDDQKAADLIMEEIGAEHIVFSFSTKFEGKDVDEFYQEAKEKYPAEIWELIYNHAQSGPLTMMLLYYEEGDAVKQWRDKMGNTHPAKAIKGSIRGEYGIEENLPNNLVHGSDSIESVKKELGVFRRLFMELEQRSCRNKQSMPSEERFREILEIEDGLDILALKKVVTNREGRITENCLDALIYRPRDLISELHSKTPEPISA